MIVCLPGYGLSIYTPRQLAGCWTVHEYATNVYVLGMRFTELIRTWGGLGVTGSTRGWRALRARSG